jgi:hypothetical protein
MRLIEYRTPVNVFGSNLVRDSMIDPNTVPTITIVSDDGNYYLDFVFIRSLNSGNVDDTITASFRTTGTIAAGSKITV